MAMSGLESALDIAALSIPGLPWSIPDEWGRQLIEKYKLELKCGEGDISGEAHALFEHNGQTIRLKRNWMRHYELFHGEWQHDPHWTGD
jgi:hypothetical protein